MNPPKDSGTPMAPYIKTGATDGDKLINDLYASIFEESVYLPPEPRVPITLDQLKNYAGKDVFFAVQNGSPHHRDGEGYLRNCKYGLALKTASCLHCDIIGDSCVKYHPKVGDRLNSVFPESKKFEIVENAPDSGGNLNTHPP